MQLSTYELVKQIVNKDLPTIVSGGSFDFNSVSEEKKEIVVKMAIHCCVNGPVGVNKMTNFSFLPGTETKIRDYAGCSNGQWWGFCHYIKDELNRLPPIRCTSINVLGEYWPFANKAINFKEAIAKKAENAFA